MATQSLTRSLLFKPQTLTFLLSRSLSSSTASAISRPPLSFLRRLRPLSAAVPSVGLCRPSVRCLSTSATSSSLSDPNPNWSNRPPKETILLDGCDFEHWLVVMEKPQDDATRDEIIDSYIKTLSQIVGSEEEARMKIYSVSTRCYYAFGCIVSEELSYKIKELPGVRWVLPDSYLDVKNKSYGGEPFIDGEAVPYDPKYHEEWIRNNARANERNRRNDRPRSFDRSRNYERRRENMQNRDFQNAPNQGIQNNPPPVSNQPVHNQDFQNPPMPNQPMNNQAFRNPPMPNQHVPNQDFRNPQMNNRDFQTPPPRPNQPMHNQNLQNPSRTPNQPIHNQNFQNFPNHPIQNQNFQNPPNQPMHNQNFQNSPMPNQPMHNQNFQSPPMPNQPMQSRGVQNNPSVPPTGNNYYTGERQNYHEPLPHNNLEWAPSSNAGEGTSQQAEWPGNSPNRDAGHPQNFQNRQYRSG